MSEVAHVLARGVHDDLVPAVKGVARAVDKALRSVARGIESTIDRIEAVEARLSGQLANVGSDSKRTRAALGAAWSATSTTNADAIPANNVDDSDTPDDKPDANDTAKRVTEPPAYSATTVPS